MMSVYYAERNMDAIRERMQNYPNVDAERLNARIADFEAAALAHPTLASVYEEAVGLMRSTGKPWHIIHANLASDCLVMRGW